jgi:hypothetical protein
MVKRKVRKVRIYLQGGIGRDAEGGPVVIPGTTIEGLLAGTRRGHYVLWEPRVIEGEDQSTAIDGHAEVPEGRVLFVQVLQA